MEGNCLSLTSLSDFVTNLENSRYFTRPVRSSPAKWSRPRAQSPELIKFTVKGTFQMAGLQPPPPPAGATPPRREAPVASLSMNKMPWWGQLLVFATIGGVAIGAYYYLVEWPQRASR